MNQIGRHIAHSTTRLPDDNVILVHQIKHLIRIVRRLHAPIPSSERVRFFSSVPSVFVPTSTSTPPESNVASSIHAWSLVLLCPLPDVKKPARRLFRRTG